MRKIAQSLACGIVMVAAPLSGWTTGNAIAAEGPKVVASIKPVHSIVAGVMRGVGAPALLLKANASPHAYALRPTDAKLLRRAALIFWIGPGLETFLERPLKTIARDATVVALLSDRRIGALPVRKSGVWRHAHTSPPGRDADPQHRHRAGTNHGTENGRRARFIEVDPHIWLDPRNAAVIAVIAAERLRRLDPSNAGIYAANLVRVIGAFDALEHDLRTILIPVSRVPYLVFHDAFQYFERRFGLNAIGSLTLSPERRPGAKRLIEIRHRINGDGLKCVFAEPQFRAALAQTVVRGTGARTAMLDPLGALVAAGPNSLAATLRIMARSIGDCLS